FVGSSALYLMAWLLAALAGEFIPGLIPWRAQLHLALLGFIGMMIFGMSYLFIPTFSGRMLARTDLALAHLLMAHLGVAGGTLALAAAPGAAWAPMLPWLLGALLWAANILQTLRSPRLEVLEKGLIPPEALEDPKSPRKRVDRWARVATAATLPYLLAGSAGLAAAYAGILPYPAALHLYTAGFIALMVFGAGYHLLPRFTGVVPPPRLAALNILLALPGPALIALTITGPRGLFHPAAGLEATAGLLFAGFILHSLLRTERRHPSYLFYAASAASLILGVLLGVAFSLRVEWRIYTPLHAWVNLLGFAGFMIVGVATDALIGYRPGELHDRRALRGLYLSALTGLPLLALSYTGAPTRIPGLLLLLLFAGLYTLRLHSKFKTIAESEKRLASPPAASLRPDLTVAEALRAFPNHKKMFQDLGVDACCMERTLTHYAQAKGLTYEALLQRLETGPAPAPRQGGETMSQEEPKCLLCGAPESKTLLLQARKQGKTVWVCPAEMPRLIHGGA
ncbi:MAG: hypothetical protein HY558_01365, partial [Euryarchaeota archaeon]|nr:hypothetical protein [Euryarchaeota archaeon]